MSMNQVERIGCLYLSFLNNPEGFSFSEIRKFLPDSYIGEPESARRKFERDKNILKKLGLEIFCETVSNNENSKYNTFNNYKYKALNVEKGGKIPKIHLSKENTSHLALIIIRALYSKNEKFINNKEKETLQKIFTKLFYYDQNIEYPNKNYNEFENINSFNFFDNIEIEARKSLTNKLEIDKNKNYLEIIHLALKNKNILEINYPSKNTKLKSKIRLVQPHGLISYKNRWGLVVFEKEVKAFRTYYLDRILELKRTQDKFNPILNFNILNFSLHPMCLNLHTFENIELEVNNLYDESFNSYLDNAKRHIKDFKKENYNYSFSVTNTPAFFRWMLSNQQIVKKIKNQKTKNKYKEYINKILDNYK